MSKNDHVELNGVIEEASGGGWYKIRLTDSKNIQYIRGRVGGKMKQRKIRVLPGDTVIVAVSPYDLTHGFITRRFK